MFYVYELIDPRDGKVFYVGKGCRDRIDQHEGEARKGRQSRKCDVIRAIEATGLTLTKRKVKNYSNEQDAYDAEADLVEFYGLVNLTNVVPGGGSARSEPTVYADRQSVNGIAHIMRLTGGRPPTVTIRGEPLDMVKVFKDFENIINRIAKKRGLDWVNAIAIRKNVSFNFVEA